MLIPDSGTEYIEFTFVVPPEIFNPTVAALERGTRKSELREVLVEGIGYSPYAANQVIAICDRARKKRKRFQCLVGFVGGVAGIGLAFGVVYALSFFLRGPDWYLARESIGLSMVILAFVSIFTCVASFLRGLATIASMDLPLIRLLHWNRARKERNAARRERFRQATLP